MSFEAWLLWISGLVMLAGIVGMVIGTVMFFAALR